MKNIEEMAREIENLKKVLSQYINNHDDLLSPQVLKMSKILDKHIVKYGELKEAQGYKK